MLHSIAEDSDLKTDIQAAALIKCWTAASLSRIGNGSAGAGKKNEGDPKSVGVFDAADVTNLISAVLEHEDSALINPHKTIPLTGKSILSIHRERGLAHII